MYSKKAKIVATMGPATSGEEMIYKLMKAGVNVFRINFSHADYDVVKKNVEIVRRLNKKHNYNVAILSDLQGPKLRVGVMKEGTFLEEGDIITFTNAPIEGDKNQAYMNYKYFATDVKKGDKILVDDGKLLFEVVDTNNKDAVKLKTIQGGELKSKKGVNLPNTKINLPALTEKDIKDAKFAISIETDWLALSFVRHANDIMDLKKLISEHSDYEIPVISKVEKPEALDNLDEIIENSTAIMVARGDLGIEVPAEQVPIIQKRIVRKCKELSKPVIVATQMMESMIDNIIPTRAEVNDVANSLFDGADAVMLSGETAVGKHPVEVIEKMSSIIKNVEATNLVKIHKHDPIKSSDRFITDQICYNSVRITEQMDIQAIITLTNTGYTAFKISSYRPNSHILAFTKSRRTVAKLNLLWGVRAFLYNPEENKKKIIENINDYAKKIGRVEPGDTVINLSSLPIVEWGKVNTLRILEVK